MYRFTMPGPELDRLEQIKQLRTQFDSFLNSDALRELFDLLKVDRSSFCRIYNGRQLSGGKILETQELEPVADLEKHRRKIYPLLKEMGFFTINKPLKEDYSHIVVLGGSIEACYGRTMAASNWMTPSVRFTDGLACYRPIHPREREADLSCYQSERANEQEADLACNSPVHHKNEEIFPCLFHCETEMGAMTESFASVFSLSRLWKDDFQGDRNLNRISCVRVFSDTIGGRQYRVFASPSTCPEQRRADTGDSLLFYLQKAGLESSDSILFLTNNRYCNRQFIQLAYLMMKQEQSIHFDIIGCTPDERVISCERYDSYQFFQDLIGVLDWIERFEYDLN